MPRSDLKRRLTAPTGLSPGLCPLISRSLDSGSLVARLLIFYGDHSEVSRSTVGAFCQAEPIQSLLSCGWFESTVHTGFLWWEAALTRPDEGTFLRDRAKEEQACPSCYKPPTCF